MQDYDHQELDRLTRYFLITLGVICFIGIIMVYSASYIYAKDIYKNSAYFLIRQLMFTGVGVGVAYFLSRTRFSFWFRMGQYQRRLSLAQSRLYAPPARRVYQVFHYFCFSVFL